MVSGATIVVQRVGRPVGVSAFDDNSWDIGEPVFIDRYWSGEPAPEKRLTEVRLLWSAEELYVRFDAAQHEPLVVSEQSVLSKKSIGLWERDVCEIFIAPDRSTPHRYFEFEIAPTGEWLDLAIDASGAERITDWDYSSGMRVAAAVRPERVTMTMAIPFNAFGRTPRAGHTWLGNLFRCVGSGHSRGYLTWQPTCTSSPDFHVPSAFGRLLFR